MVTDVDMQVEVGWEPTLVVHPSGCESGRPVGWLDNEADGWMVDEMMLDPEMSPIVQQAGIISVRSLSSSRTSCYAGVESGGDRAILIPYDVRSTVSLVPSDDCL